MMLPPFSMVAPLANADGYGQSAERLILAATELGADVQFVAYDWQERQHADPALLALEVDQLQIGMRSMVVVYFLPYAVGRFRDLTQQLVLMTMFETDSIPLAWVPGCNAADGIIVPSEHCREAFQPHVKTPIRVAPLGVDVHHYLPVVRGERPGEPFRFLMAGLLHYRKGAEFAVRAFREEFAAGEDVRLTLKSRRGFLDVGEESIQDHRITILMEDYTRDEMNQLYREHDVFLAPSRGEAAGLTPREAMATGLPTILTDWGGLAEVADEQYNYPVVVEGLTPAPPVCSSYSAGVAGNLPIGNFALPSIEHLRARMREVYEDRAAARDRGLAGAGWMRREWSWEACAGKWLDALAKLTT